MYNACLLPTSCIVQTMFVAHDIPSASVQGNKVLSSSYQSPSVFPNLVCAKGIGKVVLVSKAIIR